MGELIRSITTDEEDYQVLMNTGQVAKGIQDNIEKTKIERDTDTNQFKEYD